MNQIKQSVYLKYSVRGIYIFPFVHRGETARILNYYHMKNNYFYICIRLALL